jgi:hypothetical protein
MPGGPGQSGRVENSVVVEIVNVTNRSALKRIPASKRRFVHAVLRIDMSHRHRKSNWLSDPYETVIRIIRIGPPVAELTAAKICAGLRRFRISGRPVINESFAAVDLIEVQPRIMIDAKLRVLVLRVVSPGALHQNKRHLGDRFEAFLSNQRQHFERRPLRVLFAALPLANQVRGHVEVARKDRLAGTLSQAYRSNLIGREIADGGQARIVKPAHGVFVDDADLVEILDPLVDGRVNRTAIFHRGPLGALAIHFPRRLLPRRSLLRHMSLLSMLRLVGLLRSRRRSDQDTLWRLL